MSKVVSEKDIIPDKKFQSLQARILLNENEVLPEC